jgi:hypothetical protein
VALGLLPSQWQFGARAIRWYEYAEPSGGVRQWKVRGTDVVLHFGDGSQRPILSEQEGFIGVDEDTLETILGHLESYNSQASVEILLLDDRELILPPPPGR